jgi:hypothetical protein
MLGQAQLSRRLHARVGYQHGAGHCLPLSPELRLARTTLVVESGAISGGPGSAGGTGSPWRAPRANAAGEANGVAGVYSAREGAHYPGSVFYMALACMAQLDRCERALERVSEQ